MRSTVSTSPKEATPPIPIFLFLSPSPLQEICINMHDLNKSIRVNNATRQPQPGMGYGTHGGAPRGNPDDPVAAAQAGGGGYVRLPPNSMSSLPKQVQQQQGRPGYPHDEYMHPHHAAAAAAAAHAAYYGGEQGPPPPPPPPPPSMPPLPPRQVPPQAADPAVSAAAHASAVQQGRDPIRFPTSFPSMLVAFTDKIAQFNMECSAYQMAFHWLTNTLPPSCLPNAFQRASIHRVFASSFDVREIQSALLHTEKILNRVPPRSRARRTCRR